ncbi:hypothetical protein ISS30_07505 [bacterium]|nr:hypothetical protein [FCB group bacterium]MBL7191527.1 hypothetical protein [bacterium]
MSSGNDILSALSSGRRDAAKFLARYPDLAQKIEASSSDASRFSAAADEPNRRTSSYRGVNSLNPSPFGTRPLKDFRGIVKGKFDGLANPDVYVNDAPIDNRHQITPQRPVFHEDDIQNAERPDFGEVEGYVYLKQHPQTGGQLAGDDELRDEYLDGERLNEADLNERINWAARQRLNSTNPVSDIYLAANPDESRLIAIDAGGISSELNDDEDLARGLTDEVRESYSDDVREQLAVDTAADMNPETGIDAEFLKENPEAAVYLKNNPGFVEILNQRPQDGENFKRYYGSMKEQFQEEAIEKAGRALSGQGDFNAAYLERNPQLASDIAADGIVNPGNSLADSTVRFDTLEDKHTFANEIYKEHLAGRAADEINESPFDREYLKEHPGLAYILDKSDTLAENMRKDAGLVNNYLAPGSEISPSFRRARTALSAGYPYRSANIVDIWS